MPLTLYSTAFSQNATLPRRFTCDGANVSPPLTWSDWPETTRSFVIIVDDPDVPDPRAPTRTAVHWVVYNIPSDITQLEEGASRQLPGGARHGLNERGGADWYGPCPSVGEHRYIIQLYALDALLDLEHPTKRRLLQAMNGHVLAKAELQVRYGRTQVTAGP